MPTLKPVLKRTVAGVCEGGCALTWHNSTPSGVDLQPTDLIPVLGQVAKKFRHVYGIAPVKHT